MDASELTSAEHAIRHESETGVTDETKHARVRYGIYSMRNQPGHYVIRVRLPAGIVTPPQLNVVADLVEDHARSAVAHLTTRQGIEIADVPGQQVGLIVRQLEAAGLTTRRTGGNVVRGVVCCPLAGVAMEECFDVSPYALAVDRHFHNAPEFQRLPRKVKIAFEGCREDHVRTAVADIGLRAALQDGRRGFRIAIGGGLGAAPKLAQSLEDFTPIEALFPTVEAILRVFDSHGNRQSRARARLKWLVGDWGIERFREAVFAERAKLSAPSLEFANVAETSPNTWPSAAMSTTNGRFIDWRAGNVRAQRQEGYVAAFVRCHLGELRPAQLRRLAAAAVSFSGSVRTTIEQDVVLRWVPAAALLHLYAFLQVEGLATCCAEQIMDITRCVGAEACLSAITNPKPAANAIAAVVSDGLWREPALRSLRIRVSGCVNACSHHHAAEIGLFGVSKKVHGRPAPHYALLLGGSCSAQTFGQRVIDIPVPHAAQAVKRMLELYLQGREAQEAFAAFVARVGIAGLRIHLEDLARIPMPEQGPEFYRDLGTTKDFAVEAKEGECHA